MSGKESNSELGGISSQKGWLDTGKGYLGRCWNHCSWRCLRKDRTGYGLIEIVVFSHRLDSTSSEVISNLFDFVVLQNTCNESVTIVCTVWSSLKITLCLWIVMAKDFRVKHYINLLFYLICIFFHTLIDTVFWLHRKVLVLSPSQGLVEAE